MEEYRCRRDLARVIGTDMVSFQLLFSVTIGIVDRFFELTLNRKK